MKIPVFVSCPTSLSLTQEKSRAVLVKFLEELNLEPRALGRSDYPAELPLREVMVIARHCAGGLILGFEQFQATSGIWKRGTKGEKKLGPKESVPFPSSWNQLEAGILFGLGLPILIFRQDGISGGVFDNGVTDVFVHKMPAETVGSADKDSLKEVFLKWHARVSAHYYAVGT
ncbi:MAG: hypothetical protein LAP87_27425 [Acidobacteriia bacterium]|nr:hypothetical protein [Terriglobia bacterium]